MAIVITGENVQRLGRNGQFEYDRSTWGFSDTSVFSFTGFGTYQTQKNFSALATVISAIGGSDFI